MSNDRRYRDGDVARVQVDAEVDGFLLVLHYDPIGRLRVLFPIDPRDDARILIGRRYEVREDGGRGAFRAIGDGTGLVFAAVAAEPWRFEDVVRDGRWDYDRLTIASSAGDPEREITELVQSISGPEGFDYDVLGYRVYGASTTVVYHDYGGSGYLYDDYRYCRDWYWRFRGCHRSGFTFGISFGHPYWYDPFYRPFYYDSFYYDPFYYDPFYYPYRYRYRSFGYPYYPYYPYYPVVPVVPRAPRAVISGRPRGYAITPIRPVRNFGDQIVARAPSMTRPTGLAAPRPIDWQRPRGAEARPANGRTREFVPARGPTRDSEVSRGITDSRSRGSTDSRPRGTSVSRGTSRSPDVGRGADRAPSAARARPPARPRGSGGSGEYRTEPPRRTEPSSRGSEARSFAPPERRDLRSRPLEFRSANPQNRGGSRARGPEVGSYDPPARRDMQHRALEFRSVNPQSRGEYRARTPAARAPDVRSYSPPARVEPRARAPAVRTRAPEVRSYSPPSRSYSPPSRSEAPRVHSSGERGGGGGRSRRP